VVNMAARMEMRLLCMGANMQLLIATITCFPEFLQNEILLILLTLNVAATLCIHSTDLLLLVTVDQSILPSLWSIVMAINDESLKNLFIIGCIIHATIINNNTMANIL